MSEANYPIKYEISIQSRRSLKKLGYVRKGNKDFNTVTDVKFYQHFQETKLTTVPRKEDIVPRDVSFNFTAKSMNIGLKCVFIYTNSSI